MGLAFIPGFENLGRNEKVTGRAKPIFRGQAASSMESRPMHAISGNLCEGRCLMEAGETPACIYPGRYRFILQDLIFSQSEHRYNLHAVMYLENSITPAPGCLCGEPEKLPMCVADPGKDQNTVSAGCRELPVLPALTGTKPFKQK